MTCDYCTLDSDGLHSLGRVPVARCSPCKYRRRKVTSEHAKHRDYERFWCDHCNGWRRQ